MVVGVGAKVRLWVAVSAAWVGLWGCSSSSPAAPKADAIARGEALFHDRELVGLGANGRACSDCHEDADGFALTPKRAEARFQVMNNSGVDDPLFRAVDADDFVGRGDMANDFRHLREAGLIRIRLPLPANIKLVDPSTCRTAGAAASCETAETYALSPATFSDVWRAVPSVVNVALTGADPDASSWPRGPNVSGGYQVDGRVDTLQNQAKAAFRDHAQVTTMPAAAQIEELVAYERGLSAPVEPLLDALQIQGKTIFERACTQCHGGRGLSTSLHNATQDIVRYFDDFANCPRSVDAESPSRWTFDTCAAGLARDQQTYEISFADGFKTRRTTTDPGRALLTGYVFSGAPAPDGTCAHGPCGQEFQDDWQKLDISPLHGISNTAPYFHNNSAATLEDVAIHYEELFKRIQALFPPPQLPPVLTTDGIHADRPTVPSERAALVAYLNTL